MSKALARKREERQELCGGFACRRTNHGAGFATFASLRQYHQ
jgi:hypothetical protein